MCSTHTPLLRVKMTLDEMYGFATGASLTRDDSRNHAIYGEDVLAADVIAGRVPPPKEVRVPQTA